MPAAPSQTPSNADSEYWHEPYNPVYNIFRAKPVYVHQRNDYDGHVFTSRPFLGPLLFDNTDSDARDHCAAERSTSPPPSTTPPSQTNLSTKYPANPNTNPPKAFLSWLRLATYMAIVAIAILISFHLKHDATPLERRVALPFGLIFWLLSLACLISGLGNYVKTVSRYSRRQALVQTGWGTQVVSFPFLSR
ncbi:hypothetical protein LTR08_006948 [Meristemomyces frigidus]|nr:hypothetical protein LTR08_006948 [Meristemomyces frigidus]